MKNSENNKYVQQTLEPGPQRRSNTGGFLRSFSKLCCINIIINCIVLVVLFSMVLFSKQENIMYIYAKEASPHRVSPNFVSIGLDDIVLANGFKGFNISDKKLIKMIGYLHPAYLRIGGNLADRLLFDPENLNFPTDKSTDFYKKFDGQTGSFMGTPNYTLTGLQWLRLVRMAKKAKVAVLFDLNSLIRFENGTWDYRNAEELIKFSNKYNLDIIWELGNEPNSYQHKFNESVNASQLGRDFLTLRSILNKYEKYKDSLLVGPDVDRLQSKQSGNYLYDFLKVAGQSIDAITWHQYYLNGRTATPDDFINPKVFNSLVTQIDTVKSVVETLNLGQKSIWLGETSSAYGGGAPNMSDRFIASFCWLDKLGLSAKMGVSVVVRQAIFRGNYALLNKYYDPNPDWWVTVLYKLLVGQKVVPSYTSTKDTVRLYSQCTNSLAFSHPYSSAITVFGVNMDCQPASVRIENLPASNSTRRSVIYAFELTPGTEFCYCSKRIRCNGELLRLLPNHDLPKFRPKVLDRSKSHLVMPPFSLVFWVIPDVEVEACLVL